MDLNCLGGGYVALNGCPCRLIACAGHRQQEGRACSSRVPFCVQHLLCSGMAGNDMVVSRRDRAAAYSSPYERTGDQVCTNPPTLHLYIIVNIPILIHSHSGNWIFNFMVVMITPVAFDSIGYKTYIIFAVMYVPIALSPSGVILVQEEPTS